MSDKAKPEVVIELGGKEYTLRFSFNAMVSFEEATGKNLFEESVIKQLFNHMKPSDLRALLWSMIRHQDANLTLEQAGEMITMDNKQMVAARVMEAWLLAMPEREGDKKEKDPLAKKK